MPGSDKLIADIACMPYKNIFEPHFSACRPFDSFLCNIDTPLHQIFYNTNNEKWPFQAIFLP